MTNIELIRQEIKRRLLEDYNSGDTEIDEVAQGVCSTLLYFIDSLPKETQQGLDEAAEEYAKDETMAGLAERAFKAGANWQKEQLRDLCYQCEKNGETIYYRGEQHAIKMMKEEAAEGMVGRLTVDEAENRCEITVIMPYAMLKRLGMIGYGYGVYISKSGKNK